MKISESAQERLENLWILAEENGVGAEIPTDLSNAYTELIHLGLVQQINGGFNLTDSGKQEAANAIRRHRLAERLIADVLVTESHLLEERACNLEHALFDGIDDSVCTLLGHPRTCPHGKPIPPGKCCIQMRESVGRLIAPVNALKSGEKGRIAYIQLNSQQHLQKLMAMGVLPGVPITIISDFPSFVFQAGLSQFAVDEDIAMNIFVRLDSI